MGCIKILDPVYKKERYIEILISSGTPVHCKLKLCTFENFKSRLFNHCEICFPHHLECWRNLWQPVGLFSKINKFCLVILQQWGKNVQSVTKDTSEMWFCSHIRLFWWIICTTHTLKSHLSKVLYDKTAPAQMLWAFKLLKQESWTWFWMFSLLAVTTNYQMRSISFWAEVYWDRMDLESAALVSLCHPVVFIFLSSTAHMSCVTNSSDTMSSDVSGITEKALYLATMGADQKSGQQLHNWATPFLYFMFTMGLNQNPVVDT